MQTTLANVEGIERHRGVGRVNLDSAAAVAVNEPETKFTQTFKKLTSVFHSDKSLIDFGARHKEILKLFCA
jgi:hypothetical protein